MTGYILSILGIVVSGVLIDIIIPTGSINKYIKGIYSIFVVAVIISPVIKFLNKKHDFSIKYQEFQADNELLNYIFTMRSNTMENNLEQGLKNEGFSNVDIILKFSIENNELNYNSCLVNLKNTVISSDKLHINKYEFIKKYVKENTALTDEEIIIHE